MNKNDLKPRITMPRSDDKPLWDVLLGVFGLQALFISHKLGIFEAIGKRPLTQSQLCEEFDLERRTSQVLISTATSLGFLRCIEDYYTLTPLSEDYLLESSPTYFGHYWDLLIDNHEVFSLEALTSAITENKSKAYGGEDIYQTHRDEDETRKVRSFTRAMHSISIPPAIAWTRSIDLSRYRNMLDIGGGSGAHSLIASQHYSNLSATVFDLPTVCTVTEEFIDQQLGYGHVSIHPADMWEDPFPDADLHFYSHIYHGWSPEKCKFLTEKSFNSMPSNGRIVIHEFLYNEKKTRPFSTAAMSMLMLGWGEGEQYSDKEICGFLEEAGFKDLETKPTFGHYSIVTGVKP